MIDVEMEVGKKKERENSGKKKKNGKQSILLLDFRFLVSPNAGHNSGLPLPPPRALGVEERERALNISERGSRCTRGRRICCTHTRANLRFLA